MKEGATRKGYEGRERAIRGKSGERKGRETGDEGISRRERVLKGKGGESRGGEMRKGYGGGRGL